MNTDLRWYAGRRVLVVGGLGYIGSNLTEALLRADAEVTIITPERHRHAESATRLEAQGARIVETDARSLPAVSAAVRGQELVFNVSGRSGAVQSVEDPAGDLQVNCGGSLAILEAIRASSVAPKLVFASSRLVYGSPSRLPATEDAPLAPLCPHGLNKATVERYMEIYGRLHGVRCTTLRITNPYGPGQPRERSAYGVINFLIHRALAGLALPIYGDGAQVRDYIFIGDLVEALLVVGADPASDGRVYNVGSGVGVRLIDAARLIVETVGGGRVETLPWPRVAERIDTGDFVADIERIERETGWRPSVAFADGLRLTAAASGERGGPARGASLAATAEPS